MMKFIKHPKKGRVLGLCFSGRGCNVVCSVNCQIVCAIDCITNSSNPEE